MDASTPGPPIGRPREFDGEVVLTAVVDLFWEQGFSSTSLTDIVARTGLSKSSLYGAFGSKDALFQTALDRYLADHDDMIRAMLTDGDRGLDDLDAFLDQIEQQATNGQHRGCLAVNTATELGSLEPVLRDVGTRHRQTLRLGFTAALERAAELGEVDEGRITDLANLLVTTALGLAVMIRGGASTDEIRGQLRSVKNAMRHP